MYYVFKSLDDLFINNNKCSFAKSSVIFLGHVVFSEGIRVVKKKVTFRMNSFREPYVTQKFSWLTIYYRRFFKDAVVKLSTLTDLLTGSEKQKIIRRKKQ